MTTEIVIPVECESAELSDVLATIEQTAPGVPLRVLIRPDLNVSECRQLAMDTTTAERVCFLDYDSHMIVPGWLEEMTAVADESGAGVVFAEERWGSEDGVIMHDPSNKRIVDVLYGPAACMLLDMKQVKSARWNADIGLRNGWLGPDMEEVEYTTRCLSSGLKVVRAQHTWFHHRGGRTTMADFARTDRCAVIRLMRHLLDRRWKNAPGDPDWFKGLGAVRADDTGLNFAPGVDNPLGRIFGPVLARHGMTGSIRIGKLRL